MESLIVDVEPMVDAHRNVLACVFDVDVTRVDVRTATTVHGTTPVITLDLRLDGQRAPEEWWDLTRLMLYVAHARADLNASQRRLALPWWRRALTHARVWLRKQ